MLHKIVHVDWLRFYALRNKMDNERKRNARRSQSLREEAARQLTAHLEVLDSLASEDAIQIV